MRNLVSLFFLEFASHHLLCLHVVFCSLALLALSLPCLSLFSLFLCFLLVYPFSAFPLSTLCVSIFDILSCAFHCITQSICYIKFILFQSPSFLHLLVKSTPTAEHRAHSRPKGSTTCHCAHFNRLRVLARSHTRKWPTSQQNT